MWLLNYLLLFGAHEGMGTTLGMMPWVGIRGRFTSAGAWLVWLLDLVAVVAVIVLASHWRVEL